MKKCAYGLLSVIFLFSLIILNGCSDFSFNPLGTWEYNEEIYYVDGKEVERVEKKDMLYESTKYIFEKSGTGYITVSDDPTLNFTYDYDDEKVTLHIKQPDGVNNSDGGTNGGTSDTEYKIINNKNDDSISLVRTEKYKAKDDNGKEVEVKVEYVLVKI